MSVTLVSLHDPPAISRDPTTGLKIISLGLQANCAVQFLSWIHENPQDVLITSDVSLIEAAFPYLPAECCHVVQIHDSGKIYRDAAVRFAPYIDGVTCVARHIVAPLEAALRAAGFMGPLTAIHNGAEFPPLRSRPSRNGPLRLLYMGRVEALKGIFDFVPLLHKLKKHGVEARLSIVGDDNAALRRLIQRRRLDDMITWIGRIPHEQCYSIAAESDIFLMLSRKESFGMATIEAMSMGCVPVAYNFKSGSAEIIEHDVSGILVPLGNIDALVAEISDLFHRQDRLARLSLGSITRARSDFNSDVMSQELKAFFETVLRNSRSHRSKRLPLQCLPPDETELRRPTIYQHLPIGLRNWLRNEVGKHPRLCHWWLHR